MKIILVGESWREHEEKYAHPLVWYSGRELAQLMYLADLSPPVSAKYPTELDMIDHWTKLKQEHDIYVTNVFNERPPRALGLRPEHDNTENFFEQGALSPLPSIKINNKVFFLQKTYEHHIERLWQELSEHKPNVVVALGNFACWALLGQSGITAIRGTPRKTLRLNLKCIPTYLPAPENWEVRTDIIADLSKAKRESAYPEIRRIKRWAVCEDPRGAKRLERVTLAEIEAWFREPSEEYSIDIETGYALFTRAELNDMTPEMRRILSELIAMVSFARSPYSAVVIPFMSRLGAGTDRLGAGTDRDTPNLNYWNSVKEEAQAWRILIRELASDIPKTFQNGIFDIGHFLRNRIRVLKTKDDNMILSHAIFPEKRKALGYLGSIYSNEIAWKQMRTGGESLKREE